MHLGQKILNIHPCQILYNIVQIIFQNGGKLKYFEKFYFLNCSFEMLRTSFKNFEKFMAYSVKAEVQALFMYGPKISIGFSLSKFSQ